MAGQHTPRQIRCTGDRPWSLPLEEPLHRGGFTLSGSSPKRFTKHRSIHDAHPHPGYSSAGIHADASIQTETLKVPQTVYQTPQHLSLFSAEFFRLLQSRSNLGAIRWFSCDPPSSIYIYIFMCCTRHAWRTIHRKTKHGTVQTMHLKTFNIHTFNALKKLTCCRRLMHSRYPVYIKR